MKTRWILLASSVFLALFSLAGCGPGVYPVSGDSGNDLSTQATQLPARLIWHSFRNLKR